MGIARSPSAFTQEDKQPRAKIYMEAQFYIAQSQIVPCGSGWFHIVRNTFCAVRTRDVGYGSVVPCKNNIHYKSSVGGRWSTGYTTASETGGTVEPVASTQPGCPLLDRVWSGSNWWLHMGTYPCNRWNMLKVGACARLHSHSLVMIVGKHGMIVVRIDKKKIGTPEDAPYG